MSLQVPAAPVFPGSENPCLAWRAFYRNLIDTFARAPVLSQHGKGLLGALLTPVLTPEQYAALPGVPLGEFYEPLWSAGAVGESVVLDYRPVGSVDLI
jgi:hypothetical protein